MKACLPLVLLMLMGCKMNTENTATIGNTGGTLTVERLQVKVAAGETENLTVTAEPLRDFQYTYPGEVSGTNSRFLLLRTPNHRVRDAYQLTFEGSSVESGVSITVEPPETALNEDDFTYGYHLLDGEVENFAMARGGQLQNVPLDRLVVNRAIQEKKPITVFVVDASKADVQQACEEAGGTFFVMKCQFKFTPPS